MNQIFFVLTWNDMAFELNFENQGTTFRGFLCRTNFAILSVIAQSRFRSVCSPLLFIQKIRLNCCIESQRSTLMHGFWKAHMGVVYRIERFTGEEKGMVTEEKGLRVKGERYPMLEHAQIFRQTSK